MALRAVSAAARQTTVLTRAGSELKKIEICGFSFNDYFKQAAAVGAGRSPEGLSPQRRSMSTRRTPMAAEAIKWSADRASGTLAALLSRPTSSPYSLRPKGARWASQRTSPGFRDPSPPAAETHRSPAPIHKQRRCAIEPSNTRGAAGVSSAHRPHPHLGTLATHRSRPSSRLKPTRIAKPSEHV
jgi:hypothetical protein